MTSISPACVVYRGERFCRRAPHDGDVAVEAIRRVPRPNRALIASIAFIAAADWSRSKLANRTAWRRAGARHDLLEIVEDRYGRRATIITSQIPRRIGMS